MKIRLFFLVLWISCSGWAQSPEILYLTWIDDPSTTMTVIWHSTTGQAPAKVHYQRSGENIWHQVEGRAERVGKTNVVVHKAQLTGLQQDAKYFFRVDSNGAGNIQHFKTLPDNLDKPLRIADGGDAYLDKDLYEKMNKTVAGMNPDFVLMGGDHAYTEGLRRALKTYRWKVERWQEFLRIWTRQMVTKEGRVIPIMPVIGNHEVNDNFFNPFKKKLPFYQFFAFPQKELPYQVFKIGKEVVFFLLDSGHSFPIGGRQKEWLEEALKKHKDAAFKIPAYHMAAFPSVSVKQNIEAIDIRKLWVPLFEKYGVTFSLEHDNHSFKRTYPIWKDEVNFEKGITYLGDGCWGVPPRETHKEWYLFKALKSTCFWMLTIDKEKCHCEAFDNEGKVLDELVIPSSKPLIVKSGEDISK